MQQAGDKDAVAIAVYPGLAVCPAAARAADLLDALFVQLVLDMVVDKVPHLATALVQVAAFEQRGQLSGVFQGVAYHPLHELQGVLQVCAFANGSVPEVRGRYQVVVLAAICQGALKRCYHAYAVARAHIVRVCSVVAGMPLAVVQLWELQQGAYQFECRYLQRGFIQFSAGTGVDLIDLV
jgi:hypothetical protein